MRNKLGRRLKKRKKMREIRNLDRAHGLFS